MTDDCTHHQARLLIKPIVTPNGRYVYDTNTNKILKVDDSVFAYLQEQSFHGKGQDGNLGSSEKSAVELAIENARTTRGYFRATPPNVETFSELAVKDIENELEEGPSALSINLTELCNLRCGYCAFSGAYQHNRAHSNRAMSADTAEKAVDWYLNFQRKSYRIGFYGGEPLAARGLMVKLISDVRRRVGERAHFHFTTNATVLTNDMADFCAAQKINLTISIDGPRSVHDRYRVDARGRGTFEKIWQRVTAFASRHPEYFAECVVFNMVLAPPFELLAIRDFVVQHPVIFRRGSIMVATVNNEAVDVNKMLKLRKEDDGYAEQINELSRIYMHNLIEGEAPDAFLEALFGKSLLGIHRRDNGLLGEACASNGQCAPGAHKTFVNTNGYYHMCERVQDVSIGSVDSGLNKVVISNFLREYSEFLRTRCSGCWAIRLCGKCFNDIKEDGCISEDRYNQFCQSSRSSIYDQLRFYCEVREKNADAFKWADDVAIG